MGPHFDNPTYNKETPDEYIAPISTKITVSAEDKEENSVTQEPEHNTDDKTIYYTLPTSFKQKVNKDIDKDPATTYNCLLPMDSEETSILHHYQRLVPETVNYLSIYNSLQSQEDSNKFSESDISSATDAQNTDNVPDTEKEVEYEYINVKQ